MGRSCFCEPVVNETENSWRLLLYLRLQVGRLLLLRLAPPLPLERALVLHHAAPRGGHSSAALSVSAA